MFQRLKGLLGQWFLITCKECECYQLIQDRVCKPFNGGQQKIKLSENRLPSAEQRERW
jgi:hypothetical protein